MGTESICQASEDDEHGPQWLVHDKVAGMLALEKKEDLQNAIERHKLKG